MAKTTIRIFLAASVVVALLAFHYFDLGRFFSFADLKSRQNALALIYAEHPIRTLLGYAVIYIAVAVLSLPGAAIMTLAAGALFGLWVGTLVAAIASAIGATLAFLVVRFLLHDAVQSRFGAQLRVVNEGIAREGAFYLFTLRLIPVFPFFMINMVMALTPIRVSTFYLVSQVGMIPATIVFVNAGTQLARITSPGDILTPTILGSFALLGLFPLFARKAVDLLRRRRRLS